MWRMIHKKKICMPLSCRPLSNPGSRASRDRRVKIASSHFLHFFDDFHVTMQKGMPVRMLEDEHMKYSIKEIWNEVRK